MSSTTQRDVANALTEAMQKIAESNAKSKEATLIVEAEIAEIIDEGLGTYVVKYLGNKFNASTAHMEITYGVGDLVYVIIPNGNFDKDKVILSPVNPTTATYTSTEGKINYITIGNNLFKNITDISLCTYKSHELSPVMEIDTTGFSALFNTALKDSRTFDFTCKIQTNIEKSRRSKGNYGLTLDIPVIQSINGVDVHKFYTVTMDINNIIGDPYNLSVPALQNLYFTLPNDMIYDNKVEPKISSFIKDFIGEDNLKPDDIFITDIKLLSTLEIEKENMSGYYAIITASEGTSFLASRTNDIKTLSVTAYLNSKVTQLSKFDCYWFKENVTIDTSSEKYQHFGGVGWEILNKVSQKNISDDGKINYQYVTNTYTQEVVQEEIHCDTRFKCVLVKDNNIITSTITIRNLASDAILELTAENGDNVFPIGIGEAKLQVKYYESGITDVENPNFIVGYAWHRLDKKGNYIDNNFYTIDEFNTKKENIYYTKIHYPVSEIDETNTIVCTVYVDTPVEDGNAVKRQTIGTVWLAISTKEKSNGYIVVVNGDKLYKYDADGDAPTVADYDGPLSSAIKTIDPLSINVFKEDGMELTSDEYKVVTVNWLVPVNSMIKLSNEQKTDVGTNPGYYTISGSYETNHELKYDIDNTYNKNKTNNNILIKVSAPAAVLKETVSGVANIRFLKDGESGTNGSKYSAIITYQGYGYGEKDANERINKLQLVYVADKEEWYVYNPAEPNVYTPFTTEEFNVKLYADGKMISNTPSVQWDIFDNIYNYSGDKIISPIGIEDGRIFLDQIKWDDTENNLCATIEAKVAASRTSTVSSQTNSEEYVYAYYPIECTYIAKYEYLQSGIPTLEGGYCKVLYASDGTNPQYDNSENFYAIDTLYNEDISDLYDYSWSSSYNLTTENTVSSNCKVTPTSKYDNGIAKNFVRVDLTRSESKTKQITEKRDELISIKEDKENRLGYYQMLQNNLDIFGKFDYNSYVNRLTTASKFYLIKTNLTKCAEQILKQINKLITFSNQYKKNGSVTDNKVIALYNESLNKKEKINELVVFCGQLGTTNNIIEKIKAITPSSLIIDNKILYDVGEVPNRNCYLTLTDNIDIYNNIINTTYSSCIEEISQPGVTEYDALVQTIIIELMTFANSSELNSLAGEYNGYKEEAYRYSALIQTLNGRINSASAEISNYSYILVIDNIIKPIYESLSWYIDFYNGGGYETIISNIVEEVNILTEKINLLNDKLLPNNSVNIIHVKPIIMVYNRYELSHINGWDGNKLETGDGYLLAPQIGAGKKSDSNTFTGIVMGVKQVAEKTTFGQKIGLFGYNDGIQSLFLNAEDGSALFGTSGDGQIIIDPSQDKGLLYSSNFWKSYKIDGKPTSYGTSNYNKQGMLIDLSTPEIRFGNGNFVITSAGHATIAGGGQIAGWKIDDTQIHSAISAANGRITLDSGATVTDIDEEGNKIYEYGNGKIYSHNHNELTSIGKGFYLAADGLSIGNSIRVSSAEGGSILVGRVSGSRKWTINGNNNESYISYNTTSFNTNSSSVYIGTDGISLGSDKFYVTRDGYLQSKSGKIGGWEIGANSLSAEGITISSNGNISGDGTGGGSWSITRGNATFNNLIANGTGKIGGWTIGSTTLIGGQVTLNSAGSLTGPTWGINTDGIATFSNVIITGNGASALSNSGSSMNWGDNFSVDTSGNLSCKNANVAGTITATAGTIGGCSISSGVLKIKNANISGTISVDKLTSASGESYTTDWYRQGLVYNLDVTTKDITDGNGNPVTVVTNIVPGKVTANWLVGGWG